MCWQLGGAWTFFKYTILVYRHTCTGFHSLTQEQSNQSVSFYHYRTITHWCTDFQSCMHFNFEVVLDFGSVGIYVEDVDYQIGLCDLVTTEIINTLELHTQVFIWRPHSRKTTDSCHIISPFTSETCNHIRMSVIFVIYSKWKSHCESIWSVLLQQTFSLY